MWDDKKIESVLQTHIAHIAKRHFMISILWLWLKEWMQVIEYECSLCEMTFKMKSVLHKHIAKRHFLIFLLCLSMMECMQVKPISAVFVKGHWRWNQFGKHTLQIGISLFSYFDFAWKSVYRGNPTSAVFVKWHLRWIIFANTHCKKAFPYFLDLSMH